MTARQDNNFLEMLRALPTRATPRTVDLRDAVAPVDVHIRASRRKQGVPARIRDAGVVRHAARLVRGEG